MEIRRLQLAAFGLFTGQTLEFSHESGGLYLIFGPNEAGKSSALRALKALLYGVPERTTDNFIHTNDQLRIGGLLRAADDHELEFARRKGRKNTLLASNGEILEETALYPFLQGVTLELFDTLFGIDYRALVRGGREILEQKGEVGRLLFSAALGSSALHGVLEELDQEAESLFKPRGSVQKINAAVREYGEKSKEIRDVSLSSGKWTEHRRALSRTAEELETLRAEIGTRRKELTRLERIRRILPGLARRRDLLQKLEALGDVAVLADGFQERRQTAIRELEKAKAVRRKASIRLEHLEAELGKIELRPEMVQEGDAIEALHQKLGSHRKAMEDRPRLVAEKRQLMVDLDTLLEEVRPGLDLDELGTLRPVLNRRRRIAELGNQQQALQDAVRNTEKRQRDTRIRLEEAKQARRKLESSAVPDPLRIRKAVSSAAQKGQLDEQLSSKGEECRSLEVECADRLARLPLWEGKLRGVPSLPIPSDDGIDRFEEEFGELRKEEERIRERKNEAVAGLQEAEKGLDELQRVGWVPTEADLNAIRFERDRAWGLLRRRWLDSEDVQAEAGELDAEHDLPEAFELRVSRSDELADRLRREAERVHKQAVLMAERSGHERQIEDLDARFEELLQEREALESDWKDLWKPCRVEPRTPREMRTWLGEFDKLRDRVERWNALTREAEHLSLERDGQIETLKEELELAGREVPDSARTFRSVLSFAGEAAEEVESLQRRRRELDRQIEVLEHDLKMASADSETACRGLDEWKAKWEQAVMDLGLGPDALPSEANEMIEKIRELFSKQDQAEKLQIRIEGVDRDAGGFESEIGRVVETVAPELADLSAEQAVSRLNQLLKENRSTESRLREIGEQKKQAESEIQESQETIEEMEARIAGLCEEAGCEDPDQLEDAERRSNEYCRLRSELETLQRDLLEEGEGASLEDLEREAEGADADVLSAEIDKLNHLIEEELEPHRNELAERKGAEEKELSLMDGGDRAALLAAEAEGILARIRSLAEQYVRLRLAAQILRKEIETYRRKNEGPLVGRAGELFALLTRGSFDSLRVDFNEKDEPVLVGVRPSDSRRPENGRAGDTPTKAGAPADLSAAVHRTEEIVQVDGMSSGSRDQLYLALRLAALEQYMTRSEPMPFIVDDILVQFDDDRSAATLEVLAEFSAKTQVILFTHHSRLVEQAKKLKAKAPVSVLELHRA